MVYTENMKRTIHKTHRRVRHHLRRHATKHRHYLLTIGAILALMAGLLFAKVIVDNLGLEKTDVSFGVTFSKKYATELGLDWRKAYIATLDDLGVRALRLPAYWDDFEPQPGLFDFSDIDWQLNEARKRGVKVVLAVGMKLPRWPECHIPYWAKDLDKKQLDERVMVMMRKAVSHFSESVSFEMWQVENEPLFAFGECPEPDRELLKSEVALVRVSDPRPIVITESGELSDWLRSAVIADVLGISTYRAVWNRYIGNFFWPVTPKWYAARILAVSPFVDEVFVSELQAEPWSPGPIKEMSMDEQIKLMNPERLQSNVEFVRRMGVPEAYLWGAEWWYWMREKGEPEMWDAAKALFATGAGD